MKLKSIDLHRLFKLELYKLTVKVIEVVEKNDPEALKIKEAYDLLVQQEPQIEILKMEYGPHEATAEVNVMRKERAALVGLIASTTSKVYSISGTQSEPGVIQAHLISNLYLKNFWKHNDEVAHVKTSEFFRGIDNNEVIESAFSSMGLTVHLNNLRSVHSRINQKLTDRKTSIAARPSANIPPIVKIAITGMRNMFYHINSAQLLNPLLDFNPLISELNQELTVYSRLISTRETVNKRKKEGLENVEENESAVNNETGDEGMNVENRSMPASPEMTLPADKMIHLSVKELNENDSDITLLNQEKAAAKSSKHVQPPFIDDEDQSITS